MSYFEENTKVVSEIVNFDASKAGATPGGCRFVILGTGGVTLAGAEAAAYGVLTHDAVQGAVGRIAIDGIVPVIVGAGGVTKGAAIGVGANGVALSTATKKVGTAVLTAAAGEIVPVKLELPAS